MTRYVSFGVLLGVILVLCIVFYRVMASFLLPLFLATILVVIFRPVHLWVLEKCKQRNAIASGITTTIISLSVIVPVGLLGLFAIGEAREMFKSLSSGGIEQNIIRVRKSLNLEIPSVNELHELELEVRALDTRNLEDFESARSKLSSITNAIEKFQEAIGILKAENEAYRRAKNFKITPAQISLWDEFRDSIKTALEARKDLLETLAQNAERQKTIESKALNEKDEKEKDKTNANDAKSVEPGASDSDPSDSKSNEEQGSPDGENQKETEVNTEPQDFETEFKLQQNEYRDALENVGQQFDKFKVQLLGGQLNVYLKELANPTEEEFKKYNESITTWIKVNLLSLSGKTTQALFMIFFNGTIMMVAVYFFLLDGSKMIDAFKFLSPLDDRHEQELIDEFDNVSRAVVVATLAAALAQGFLAGIGYYFAGVDAVFLLTMLTAVFALVPFVGAGSVWLPTCLYLYLIEDRLVPAVCLAIWGASVVSTIDNLIKPYILHGQSNIHPLFALLSVLGGVTALGPIGILVGPMVVVFLQTLLKILQRELLELDADGENSTAESDDENVSESKDESKSQAEVKANSDESSTGTQSAETHSASPETESSDEPTS